MSNVPMPLLWYTSGTPLRLGQRECAYERWLSTHAGRHGTGYRKKAVAVPLATGKGVHDGIGLIGEWIMDWQGAHSGQRLLAVPDEVTAWAATEAADRYAHRAHTKGLELTKTDLDAAAAGEQLILEQRTLIEAQVWIYAIARLPVMLAQARLVSVEQEEGPVVDCTCGLGDWVGQSTDHAARSCQGIVAQGRADFIWEMIDGGALVYEELKTKSTPNYGWEQQWEHSGQLWLNMEAASKRLGKEVSQAFVPVLYKGKRDRTDRDDKTSPKIQQSPLVYGWFDPGAPPMRPAEWSARYKWVDDWGKWHTLPRTYKRSPIWQVDPDGLPLPTPNGITLRGGAGVVECWVKGWILSSQYPDLLQVLGPFPKPAILMTDAQRALVVEERKWRTDVEWLRKAGIFQPRDKAAADPTGYQITAADIIPRSWACTKFDGTACMGKRFCHREPGWEDVLQMGDYEIRTPHHQIEKDAMTPTIEALGLEWPDEDGDFDAE